MARTRIMPCLLLKGLGLVKTVRFKNSIYLGDPRNTLKIFNEKEVDELILLDILATINNHEPNLSLLQELTSECFMPLCYGGGIRTLAQMESLFRMGVEKISLNTAAAQNPSLIRTAANHFGSQSVVAAIDAKRSLFGNYEVYIGGGKTGIGVDPVTHAKRLEDAGAGEILLNSIDRDGTMQGYDLDLLRSVTSHVRIPVIACGGAGRLDDFSTAVKIGGASACAAGSIFVFHGPHRAVLISFPKHDELLPLFC